MWNVFFFKIGPREFECGADSPVCGPGVLSSGCQLCPRVSGSVSESVSEPEPASLSRVSECLLVSEAVPAARPRLWAAEHQRVTARDRHRRHEPVITIINTGAASSMARSQTPVALTSSSWPLAVASGKHSLSPSAQIITISHHGGECQKGKVTTS